MKNVKNAKNTQSQIKTMLMLALTLSISAPLWAQETPPAVTGPAPATQTPSVDVLSSKYQKTLFGLKLTTEQRAKLQEGLNGATKSLKGLLEDALLSAVQRKLKIQGDASSFQALVQSLLTPGQKTELQTKLQVAPSSPPIEAATESDTRKGSGTEEVTVPPPTEATATETTGEATAEPPSEVAPEAPPAPPVPGGPNTEIRLRVAVKTLQGMTLSPAQKQQFQKLLRETRPRVVALLKDKNAVETEQLLKVHQEQERVMTAIDAILTPEQRTEFREKMQKTAQEMQASKQPKRPKQKGLKEGKGRGNGNV
jgi:Spy/CpxP family protein refolding chaperone